MTQEYDITTEPCSGFQGIGGRAIQQAFCKFGPNFIACREILNPARTRLYGVVDYQIGWHNLLPYRITQFHLCLASVLWGEKIRISCQRTFSMVWKESVHFFLNAVYFFTPNNLQNSLQWKLQRMKKSEGTQA